MTYIPWTILLTTRMQLISKTWRSMAVCDAMTNTDPTFSHINGIAITCRLSRLQCYWACARGDTLANRGKSKKNQKGVGPPHLTTPCQSEQPCAKGSVKVNRVEGNPLIRHSHSRLHKYSQHQTLQVESFSSNKWSVLKTVIFVTLTKQCTQWE